MIEFTKIELYKILKSRQYISILSALIIFIIIAMLIMFFNKDKSEVDLFTLIYNVFAFNSDIFFPTVSIAFFSSIITKEFQDRTMKLLIGAKFSRKDLILGKFIAGAITFSLIFFTVVLIAFTLALILPIQSLTYLSYDQIGILNIFGRTILITLCTIIYLISYGGLSFLLALLIRNQAITMLCSIGLLIFYLLIPVPGWLTDYIFIGKGAVFYTAMSFLHLPYLEIIKTVLVCLLFLFVFLIISISYMRNLELKEGV
ncbi:ABC transporter permease [Radiobacillus deserti]|uniref:ABC transporter permease subunit n=1 Tax=Radiobacillus deserti TaxID=2594883 RepID=A0A516KKP5_9BACI|nr:ABC transporter permease subunit [Radiobacillus deserti]QDP41964.1 ABC transporter permease subunit [Radiobacillus deserti]